MTAAQYSTQSTLLLRADGHVIALPPPPEAPTVFRALLPRGERERLPSRRKHETFAMGVGGHKIKIQIGTRSEGSVCELFLRLHKEGAPLRALMHTIARLVSACVQYGMPLAEIAADLRAHEGGPVLDVEGHEEIGHALSLIDAIGQVLETYPDGRKEGAPCG